MGGGVTVSSGEYGQAFALQFIIIFNLMFVVTAFATDTICYIINNINEVVHGDKCWTVRENGGGSHCNVQHPHSWASIRGINEPTQILGALGGAGTYCVIKFPNDDENSEL
ncbi:hypothetical protein Ahy_B03g067750 [Arachis hypogaea]|uniref:Uncharacterized protein n=1 Tax=Arachis hypogaea TaxID=3818 RepID=A0A445A7N4_ARAHY|nr:hypothetical protein Ahy_B03g067750 [Arachis hypogaea]